MKKVKLYNDFINEEKVLIKKYQKSSYEKFKDKLEYLKLKASSVEGKLKMLGIEKYQINKDGTVDVYDTVTLSNYKNLCNGEIPIKFGKVEGGFYCQNLNLKSLKNCPYYVGGCFNCSNNELTSLMYGPREVISNYYCSNNKLTSLDYLASEIGLDLMVNNNKLKSLNSVSNIEGNIFCSSNNIDKENHGFEGYCRKIICGGINYTSSWEITLNENKINELSEFNFQRFGNPIHPWVNQPNDPNLSFDAYERHTDQARMANIRLNTILAGLIQTGDIYNKRQDRIIDRQDLSNLVIQRMYDNDSGDLDIYIKFEINKKEYFGVIKNFIHNPELNSECFRDYDLILTKEWVIRTKGLIIKIIRRFLNVESGDYKALKEIYCTDNLTGKLYSITEGMKIKVLRAMDDKIIAEIGNNIISTLDGKNFYFFNYYFTKIEN